MPNYEVTFQATSNSAKSMGEIHMVTAGARRFKVYSMTFSSESTPAEVALLWKAGRITTIGSGGAAVVPKPKDMADSVCVAVANQAIATTEPTYTTGEDMYSNAVHQRATVRWIARDDQDMIVCPATNIFGLGFKTPTINGGAPNITLDVGFIE